MKILIPILLLIASNCLSAQYIHYQDRSQINKTAAPAKPTPTPIKQAEDSVVEVLPTVTHIRDLIPPKNNLATLEINSLTPADSILIYHSWPDKCPGMAGAIPVLNNYVPPIMVLKLTEIFQGHLYAITTLKIDKDVMHYELKVCVNGVIRYDFADENGTIID